MCQRGPRGAHNLAPHVWHRHLMLPGGDENPDHRSRGHDAWWVVMSTSRSRRFPVTVAQLPVTRCQICDRTLAYRPGNVSEVLTEHYRRAHPEALGIPAE
jgi:hypothetical protein